MFLIKFWTDPLLLTLYVVNNFRIKTLIDLQLGSKYDFVLLPQNWILNTLFCYLLSTPNKIIFLPVKKVVLMLVKMSCYDVLTASQFNQGEIILYLHGLT